MSDNHLSYLTESLNNICHYIDYRGRSYQDLATLQKTLNDLNFAINIRLIRDFKDHPEVAELFKLLETQKNKD